MKAIPVEKFSWLTIDEALPQNAMIINESSKWMKVIIACLTDQVLLDNRDEAQKLSRRATKFILQDEILYKRSFSHPLIRYITKDYVIQEIYKEVYGNHTSGMVLVQKALK
ncbi:Uncharacterized protein Adt_02912 [Abeliophyllum distichum]|uniref:Uncharacterized protein n=1 Tax=Abeliophyllum distichum TaxID=126358 RepID=A0ABD1VWZ7_9LAMI